MIFQVEREKYYNLKKRWFLYEDAYQRLNNGLENILIKTSRSKINFILIINRRYFAN